MLVRLLLISIVSANLGYTVFLLPLLGVLYGDRVPFTVFNVAAFALVDSVGGVLLALTSYLIARVGGVSVCRSSAISVVLLWAVYWLTAVYAVGGFAVNCAAVVVMLLDGLAAIVTWVSLSALARFFLRGEWSLRVGGS